MLGSGGVGGGQGRRRGADEDAVRDLLRRVTSSTSSLKSPIRLSKRPLPLRATLNLRQRTLTLAPRHYSIEPRGSSRRATLSSLSQHGQRSLPPINS